jgi:hypothetical protein
MDLFTLYGKMETSDIVDKRKPRALEYFISVGLEIETPAISVLTF